jgi:chemotaxis protein MotB
MLLVSRKGLIKVHDTFVRNKLREKQHSAEIENSWEISYGDMITLLLAFFVMFFNIKSETINMKLIKKDLDKYFSTPKDTREPTSDEALDKKTGAQKANLPIISSQVQNSLKVKSNMYGQNIMVDFPGVEFFKSGKIELTKEGKHALKEFTSAISSHLGSFRLVVRGYTDSTPLGKYSKFKDNLELSASRSISAIRYMSQQGVQTQYMRIAGYGESDGLRDEKMSKATSRKISIVLEPLEHSEKADSKTATDSRSKKAIEDVKSANIAVPGAKEARASGFNLYVDDAKKWLEKTGVDSYLKKVREPASYARWIESKSLYQKAITWSVHQELRHRGYTAGQIRKMIDNKDKVKTFNKD